ncbi:UNVERIFIED_CONTAM: hypothetical protein FKN15_057587 [Acipenser sinensis]
MGHRHHLQGETSGVAELTSKMSQFMEVMMGQQSLLMTLANVVPRAPELPTGPVAGQPVVPPPVPHGQPQEVWDVDAVSRDASDAEPLFEEGTEPEVTSQHSEQDDPEVLDTNDPMWSVVERAARHLGVDWPASEPTRRSLFELPSAHTLQSRILPAFPDFIKEVQSTWGAPASTPATSRKAAAFNMHGASEAGLASFPPVGAAFAALVKAPTLSGLAKDPSCPNRQCRITEAHLKKGYAAATEAVRLSNVASLLTVYQAALLRDLPECPSAALRTELGTVAQLLVKLAQLNARAQGRSIASLVVARRQLWLSQARVQEPDKVPLLDAPISPGHTFGPAVEEMLQRSVKAREASQQLAKMWPSKPFQPRRPQERQWRRAPPQQQAQSRGSMTAPSGVSARGQPAFVRPQRGGWRPRGGGKPRPRGSGQAPQLFSTPTLTVLPGASVWEGEAVTLQCGAHINKQGTQLQYRYSKDNGTVRGAGSLDQHSIPAAGLIDTGRYQCEVEAAGTGLKKRSASVSLTVRALFSRVTLTTSPGATVKEGEALNLICEAAVNKTPRPELHYTIVRDGETVTNSTDSALYSIASTEKSHTGSYTCAVESQGVRKSSQELHIEVQSSSCLAGGKSRKTSDQDQEQSAEGIELSSRVQHTGVELE